MGEDLAAVSHSRDQRNKWKDAKPWKIEHKDLNLHIKVFDCITVPAVLDHRHLSCNR